MAEVNGSVGTNGASTESENRVKGKLGKGKARTRFARLYAAGKAYGSDHALGGVIPTEEGELKVRVQGFPVALEDKDFENTAAAESMSVTFPLGMRELSGVALKNGRCQFEGAGARKFLKEVKDSADMVPDDDDGE
jgi:hypothetical protein